MDQRFTTDHDLIEFLEFIGTRFSIFTPQEKEGKLHYSRYSGSAPVEDGEPGVFVSATNHEILKKSLEAGATKSPSGNPIVGTAGLLIGLAKFKEIDASCLLVETPGYLPDPKAARSVLKVIMKMLNFEVDLSDLDKEISKSKQIEESMRKIEKQRRKTAKRKQKIQEERVTYIS